MAPPKTMVLSQQQAPQVGQQADQQAARQGKPRKRKSNNKPSMIDQQILTSRNEQQQVNSSTMPVIESAAAVNGHSKEGLTGSGKVTTLKPSTTLPIVVATERTTIKQKQQVPTPVKTENGIVPLESPKRAEPVISVVTSASLVVGKKQQLSTEESDDIDAGIELDGSSNSGSSVKDINDDQLKSTSVSPVMAQSNPVNETTCVQAQPHKQTSIEVVEKGEQQLACEVATVVTTLCSAPSPAKKISLTTTKQQLAANQQVIDADERLLQERLQNKQRRQSQQENNVNDNKDTQKQLASDKGSTKTLTEPKTSVDSAINSNNIKINSNVVTTNTGASGATAATRPDSTSTSQIVSSSNAAPTFRRRFSSTHSISQEGQDNSLCKICEQHVYQMERILAEKSVYHKRCFRCHQCKNQLRVDNYSSHEGQVYCKAHHRQIFQPQVKLDSEDDVDIVAQSTSKPVDDYLLHRGRLSELSFSFLQPKPEGIRKRQMIICENEPAELPKDVVRSDTKLDDGIQQLNLNLNNILEKFERGTAGNGSESQPSSAGVVVEKPSFNIKKTLMAFESRLVNNSSNSSGDDSSEFRKNDRTVEQPVVKKLTNLTGFLNRQNSIDNDESNSAASIKPLAVRRSESLLMRLKKYESRIAGEQVDDEDSEEIDDENNNKNINNNNNDEDSTSEIERDNLSSSNNNRRSYKDKTSYVKPKKLTSIDLSSLKNQWENGDISRRKTFDDDADDADDNEATTTVVNKLKVNEKGSTDSNSKTAVGDITSCNGKSPLVEKNEELCRIREQLAQKKKVGEAGGSVRNIYENAIKEAQLQQKQQQASTRRESSDLSTLNGFSTSGIQQQLLQNGSNSQTNRTPTTLDKDHFQLNLSKKANKLKEKFELGLITNSSHDDSDQSDSGETPALTKLEQIRQEKLEDLSVFTDGEIKAREARSLFQQIDRRLSAEGKPQQKPVVSSRSLASIGASMRAKLTNQMNSQSNDQAAEKQQQPIRLTNNVRM